MLFARQPALYSHFGTPTTPSALYPPPVTNSCRIRISAKHTRNPFRMRISKTKDLKLFRMNIYRKTGEGVPLLVAQTSVCALLSPKLSTVDFLFFSSNQLLQILLRPSHILHLLLPRDLSLNRHCPRILHLLQPRNNRRKIHLPLSNRHFLTQILRIRRPPSVLSMNPLHIRPKNLNRIHRIRLPIQNQIRQIKIHSLIVQPDIPYRAHQSNRRLLPRLIPEILPVPLAVFRNLPHRNYGFFVQHVIRIFRNESAMRLHRRHAALLRKIRRLLDMRNPRRSRISRHQPNRQRSLIKIPHLFARPANHHRRRLNPVLPQRLPQTPHKSRRKLCHIHLASRQAKLMDFSHRRVRIIPNPNNQSQPQRLLPLIPKRFLRTFSPAAPSRQRLKLFPAHKNLTPQTETRGEGHRRTLQKSPAIPFLHIIFFDSNSIRHILSSIDGLCSVKIAAHFLESLGVNEEGTSCLVISVPVITALRIWPKRSVSVFGVCGINTVLVRSFAAMSFKVSKYCVIKTSCMTSCGVEPGTVFAKSSTESFKPEMMDLRWLAMPSPCSRVDSASASACFTKSNLFVSARDTVASRSRCAALISFIAAFTFWSGTISEISTFTIE